MSDVLDIDAPRHHLPTTILFSHKYISWVLLLIKDFSPLICLTYCDIFGCDVILKSYHYFHIERVQWNMISQMIMLSILLTLIIFVILFIPHCVCSLTTTMLLHTHEHKHIQMEHAHTKIHLPKQTTTHRYFRTVHEFP